MRNTAFATIAAAGLVALSLGLAAPAFADDWDNTPVVTGNDTPFNTGYRQGGPQGTPIPPVRAGAIGEKTGTFSGGPASSLPATSIGANPFVPLGPGH
jgi:hypothetical protein